MQSASSAFPDRDTVASKISTLSADDEAWLRLLLENPQQDEALLEGLLVFLDKESQSRFLNALKLESAVDGLVTMPLPDCRSAFTRSPRAASTRLLMRLKAGSPNPAGLKKPTPSHLYKSGTRSTTAMIGPIGKKTIAPARRRNVDARYVPSR